MSRKRSAEVGFCSLLALVIGITSLHQATSSGWDVIGVVFSSLFILVGALLLDMCRLNPADSHTWWTLAIDYFYFYIYVPVWGTLVLRRFDGTSSDCREQQGEALRKNLAKNRDTLYCRDHDLQNINSREELIKRVPLSTMDNYAAYLERSFHGDTGALTSDEVVFFGSSSGTSGKPKHFPLTQESLKTQLDIMLASLKKHSEHRRAHGLARILNLYFLYPKQMSPLGVSIAAIGMVLYKPLPSNIIPACVHHLTKHHAYTYVAALFALAEPEIGHIEGFCIDLYVSFFNFILIHQDRLCMDIEQGRVSPFPDIDESIRQEASRCLRPDKSRATSIRRVLQGPPEGLCRRLWPRLQTVRGGRVATFKHTARMLLNTFFKGLSMNYFDHVATESIYGICLEDDPDSEEFTFIPGIDFLEFIPESEIDKENPKTVFMEDVEVGHRYEIVSTTNSCLYRYRSRDVIQITGFRGNVPKYEFIYRIGFVMCIRREETTEAHMAEAIQWVQESLETGERLDNFGVTECYNLDMIRGYPREPLRYVFFYEIDGNTNEHHTTEKHIQSMVEKALCHVNAEYAAYRNVGGIGPIEVIQVRNGAFHEMLSKLSAPTVQTKFSRVLRRQDLIEFLWENRIQQDEYHTLRPGSS